MRFSGHNLQKRKLRLSSAWTLPAKLVPLPLIVYGVVRLWIEFYGENLEFGKIAGFLLYSCVCLVVSYFFFPLKSVYLQNNSLRISNYLDTIEIPFSHVKEIVDRTGPLTGSAPGRIILVLHRPTVFGSRIPFIPQMSLAPNVLDEIQRHSRSQQKPPMSY